MFDNSVNRIGLTCITVRTCHINAFAVFLARNSQRGDRLWTVTAMLRFCRHRVFNHDGFDFASQCLLIIMDRLGFHSFSLELSVKPELQTAIVRRLQRDRVHTVHLRDCNIIMNV